MKDGDKGPIQMVGHTERWRVYWALGANDNWKLRQVRVGTTEKLIDYRLPFYIGVGGEGNSHMEIQGN